MSDAENRREDMEVSTKPMSHFEVGPQAVACIALVLRAAKVYFSASLTTPEGAICALAISTMPARLPTILHLVRR